MLRLFKTSGKRHIAELDSTWRMIPDFDGTGAQKGYGAGLPQEARNAFIPSCWHFELDLFHHYGDVWYETEFEAKEDNVVLCFGAVNNACEVYVDGKQIHSHYGPFCEFEAELAGIGKGNHTLVLKVNNVTNKVDTIPQLGTDWFDYGGIIRPVEVHSLKECRLSFHTRYDLNVEDRCAEVEVIVEVTPYTGRLEDTLCVSVGGKTVASKALCVTEKTTESLRFSLEDLALWDIGQGNLYTVTVSFGGDELTDRIGFRKFTCSREGFQLNGRPLKLRGVNRHEEDYETGFAVTPNQIRRDIAIIKDLGCNMIRGSHYPNSKLTLDMLDEEGLLFWEEIPIWGFEGAAIAHPMIHERAKAMHREMVTRDRNHPCIVIWGLLNESGSDSEETKALLADLRAVVTGLDNTRLITYATHRPRTDISYEYADFISINAYPGWYGKDYKEWPEELKVYRAHADSMGQSHKPMIISEFGAGGIKGDTAFDSMLWSETYQNEFFDWVLPRLCDSELLSGTIIWQFCDMRSSEYRPSALRRPRGFNNKGLVDEHRCPKQAYFTVKREYRSRSKSE